jgi:propionyl-CoA carboxylase beta chain
MGPEAAVEIVYKKEIAALPAAERAAATQRRVAEYRERFANPYVAAERGYVDAVIDPRETRPRLVQGLRTLADKRDANPPRKHGNIPL